MTETTRPAAHLSAPGQEATPDPLFAGPGEMRALARAFDWASTPLGPSERWSHALRTTVGIILASRNPMFLWWGPQLVQIYNDAYRPSLGLGARHPGALGARGREFWTDIWPEIGPQIHQVMTTGEPTWHEDQFLPIERNGRLEDVWWTYGYSPVFEDDGTIGGTLVVCQEVTSRMQAERERVRLVAERDVVQRRAERVIEQIADEHLTMDANYRILTLNASAERNLGVPRDSLIGRTHWEAFPASIGTIVEAQYRRVMAERVEAHFTHHYVGEQYDRHLEIDAYPTDDGGIAVFWRDVSERVRAEAALRESETRYRALFNSLDEGFCVIEVLFDDGGRAVDYRFLETNPAFERQTGLVNVIGKRILELAPGHESHWFESYGRVALSGEPMRFDAPAEALHRYYDVYAFRIGKPEERTVAVLFNDISAEHSAEQDREQLVAALEVERARLKQVFQRAPSFIVAMRGPDQVYEFVNEAYYQLVGHRDILGKPLLEALPEIRGQGFVELLERVRVTGEPWVGRESPVELQRTPGAPLETRYLDMVFQTLTEIDGTRTGVVAHGSDVTQHVLARREIERLLQESERARTDAEEARAEAEGASRAKGEFLAVMSHELRTPLNAIGGYAELMEMGLRGPITAEQRTDLARIQASQRHLLGLINQVLNYTRIETGTVQYDLTGVPVSEALASAEALVIPQVRARGLRYVLGGCDPALRMRADAEKLQQILLNLLSNAIKFTEPGGEVRVECRVEGEMVEIIVADTGVGIPSDKLTSVFEPFVQVDQRLTRANEGVGLGLAISRDLARGMGGDLRAESEVGVGSRFVLRLPVETTAH
ncbi:MAG TPA: PAS domain-containing protein [Gemmatimonadaceae bacterium]|nr:PAS domain-containing protein [Gemmatimonadaceae bacterium]